MQKSRKVPSVLIICLKLITTFLNMFYNVRIGRGQLQYYITAIWRQVLKEMHGPLVMAHAKWRK